MIQSFFFRIRFRIQFADALRNDFRVALLVACILAVLTLHTSGVLEKVPTERASHDVVELLRDELMAIHLVDFLLTLANGALPV